MPVLRYPPSIFATFGLSARPLNSWKLLQFFWPNPTGQQVHEFCFSAVEVALILDGPLVAFVFRFGANLVLDTSFDVAAVSEVGLSTLEIDRVDDGFLFDLVGQDLSSRAFVAWRQVVFPRDLSLQFLHAARAQLTDGRDREPYFRKHFETPMQTLVEAATFHTLKA